MSNPSQAGIAIRYCAFGEHSCDDIGSTHQSPTSQTARMIFFGGRRFPTASGTGSRKKPSMPAQLT